MSDKPKKDMDIARKVWLAGIGAYGRAIGDAQDAYAKMGKETTRVFEELVGRGEDLEGTVKSVAKNYTPKMAEQTVRATMETVSDRMERMKAALGITEVAADQQDQIESIETRLDSIEAKVDEILVLVKAMVPPAAKKTGAKKTAAKKTVAKKSTTIKAPPKNPAAKKATK
ncbi:MAG: phasin family protein [Kordiimonadaceae bacterium]|nr:phasin family protein [Kordiimonadaceae bacterium]